MTIVMLANAPKLFYTCLFASAAQRFQLKQEKYHCSVVKKLSKPGTRYKTLVKYKVNSRVYTEPLPCSLGAGEDKAITNFCFRSVG